MSITNTIRGFGLGLILTGSTILAGCHTAPERGALIGAGVGGVLGAAVDEEEPARGAIIGAAIGAVGGFIIGEGVEHADGHGYHDHPYDHDHRPGDVCVDHGRHEDWDDRRGHGRRGRRH